MRYEACTTDSYSNTCATNCCSKFSGGILDPVKSCTNDATMCTSGTNITITTHKCGIDLP